MSYEQCTHLLVFVSGTLRVLCLFFVAMAIHDVIRNGLHIRTVPLKARVVLYFSILAFGLSAMASVFRLSGESWAPMFREVTHASVSLGVIFVAGLVLYARSCAGVWMECITGEFQPITATGPGRARTPNDTDFEELHPLPLPTDSRV